MEQVFFQEAPKAGAVPKGKGTGKPAPLGDPDADDDPGL
jgi:hypothetical protein